MTSPEDAALLHEAEAVMNGRRHLTVAHGIPETDEEQHRLSLLRDAAWRGTQGAQTLSVGGGGDYTTITVEGPAADTFIDLLAALAHTLDPGWWKLRRSSR